MGYWSTIDKNQKRINQLNANLYSLTEKVNELEQECKHLEKINNLQAGFLQSNESRIDKLEKQLKALQYRINY
tara:strand:- start:437 stop:655 length:219 start_codon:yes stop_codon:yes gene_type:complete